MHQNPPADFVKENWRESFVAQVSIGASASLLVKLTNGAIEMCRDKLHCGDPMASYIVGAIETSGEMGQKLILVLVTTLEWRQLSCAHVGLHRLAEIGGKTNLYNGNS